MYIILNASWVTNPRHLLVEFLVTRYGTHPGIVCWSESSLQAVDLRMDMVFQMTFQSAQLGHRTETGYSGLPLPLLFSWSPSDITGLLKWIAKLMKCCVRWMCISNEQLIDRLVVGGRVRSGCGRSVPLGLFCWLDNGQWKGEDNDKQDNR